MSESAEGEPEEASPTPGALSGLAVARRFLLGGRATTTLVSKTGKRVTYRISLAKLRAGQQKDEAPFYVDVLTGSNNEDDYTPIGMLFYARETGELTFRHYDGTWGAFRKSSIGADADSVKGFWWLVEKLNGLLEPGGPRELPEGVELYHEGRCSICSRKLTTPESVASGVGPKCAEKGQP